MKLNLKQDITSLDWSIIGFFVSAILLSIADLVISPLGSEKPRILMQPVVTIPFSIAGNLLLIYWMLKDGAKSKLWEFLPPFYPWGELLNNKGSRWLFIIMLNLSCAAGIAFMVL